MKLDWKICFRICASLASVHMACFVAAFSSRRDSPPMTSCSRLTLLAASSRIIRSARTTNARQSTQIGMMKKTISKSFAIFRASCVTRTA